MILTYIKKCRKVAGMIIISIPKEIIELGEIHEGDSLEVKIKRLNKHEKVRTSNKIMKAIREKRVIPEQLKQAVLTALSLIYKEELNNPKYIENVPDLRRDKTSGIQTTTACFTEFWASYSYVLGTIKLHKLCDLVVVESSNIHKDIGLIMENYGFIQLKRNPSGTHRLINVERLNRLCGIETEKTETFKLKPKIDEGE